MSKEDLKKLTPAFYGETPESEFAQLERFLGETAYFHPELGVAYFESEDYPKNLGPGIADHTPTKRVIRLLDEKHGSLAHVCLNQAGENEKPFSLYLFSPKYNDLWSVTRTDAWHADTLFKVLRDGILRTHEEAQALKAQVEHLPAFTA